MNILPLILALVLMLTVMTVEKLEKFKNQAIVQKEYQTFLKMIERQEFNSRQEKLYEIYPENIKQLSFRFFLDEEARKKNPSLVKQYRLLNLALMNDLYSKASFFKELKQRRPTFLDELADAIEEAAQAAPKQQINDVEDIARLDLKDPDLQKAFYHMLKGTVTRKELKEMGTLAPGMQEKAYVSLFNFINYNGKKGVATIKIQHAPREILKVIFLHDEVVEAIITRRKELAKSKDNGAQESFKREFLNKRRDDIDDQLLDFSLSKSNKAGYD